MTPDLLAKYDRPVPRYTSYPTAPHFHPGVGADAYRRWLAGLPADLALSLYVHVPFCHRLCWYCGCHTTVARRYRPVADYLATLAREVDLVAAALGAPRRAVRHVHLGGGTPTILAPDDLRALARTLQGRFDLAPGAEFAVEIDPRGLTPEAVTALAEIGVDRASLGVQDVNPEVQRAINRDQPFAVTERVVGWLRDAGIGRVNLDLMYGLPHQTAARVLRSVEAALELAPDRVALFGYGHVPWMKRHQRLIDEAALPDAAARAAQYGAAAARLVEAGYVAIGLDHFARPDDDLAVAFRAGRLRRNFQGYTTDAAPALLGLGASAIGALPQGYVQNAVRLDAYREAVRGGALATVRGVAVGADDRLRREVIERLMCRHRVDLGALRDGHGRPAAELLAPELAALAPLAADGLVAVAGGEVRVLPAGQPLVRTVCAVFDAYLGAGAGRHSRPV